MRKLVEKTLIVATHNPGKLREITNLIKPFGLSIKSAPELGLVEPKETGTQFEENAYIKAFAAAKETNLPALSDDSGLEVLALGGAPGVYTADWATMADGSRDFNFGMRKVEDALQKCGALTEQERKARFICVLCLAWPDGKSEYFRGTIDGTIVWPPRGKDGFGFDAIFLPDGFNHTFGEMTAEQKHGWKPGDDSALSHRARAFRAFAETLPER